MTPTAGLVLGLLGVAFTLASFAVQRMVALRVLALVGNASFVAYGVVESQLPSIALNCVLIPLNLFRLWEIRRLTREIARAGEGSPVSEWLLPHMRRRAFRAGDVLFRRGETADRIVYLSRGELRLAEVGVRIAAGELIGEIGLFSPGKQRTQTVVCATDGELYEMTEEMVFQLYYQNPRLGFYFIRLMAERLLRDTRRGAPVQDAGAAPA